MPLSCKAIVLPPNSKGVAKYLPHTLCIDILKEDIKCVG